MPDPNKPSPANVLDITSLVQGKSAPQEPAPQPQSNQGIDSSTYEAIALECLKNHADLAEAHNVFADLANGVSSGAVGTEEAMRVLVAAMPRLVGVLAVRVETLEEKVRDQEDELDAGFEFAEDIQGKIRDAIAELKKPAFDKAKVLRLLTEAEQDCEDFIGGDDDEDEGLCRSWETSCLPGRGPPLRPWT